MDIYFDTFLEADVALDYSDELLGAVITINHPISDFYEEQKYQLEIIGYWTNIDEAFKKYAEMKKAFELRTEEVYSKMPKIDFGVDFVKEFAGMYKY